MANYSLLPAHWAPNSTVTWYYSGTASAVFTLQSNNGYPTPDLFPGEIQAAFNKWDSYSNGITFKQVFSPSQANIVLGWGALDGPSGTIGQASYSYFPSTGLFASPVQIKFDWAELYNPTSGAEKFASNGASFFSVALHEVGHAIGIDHYTGGPAIMNPFINPGINDLTASDIAAVQALYGAQSSNSIAWDFSWKLVAVGQFNGDGTTDVVWQNSAGALGGWLMSNNIRGATMDLPNFAGWTAIGTGDFDGNGTDDILWQNSLGLVGEWFMGGGTRQGTANIQYMAGWTVLATGDFNGDGTSDIVWSNGAGFLGGWLMQNGQIAATMELPFFPDWDLVATGDFNGDGTTDMLWQHSSGQVGEWLMAGGTRAATFNLWNLSGWTSLGSGDFNNDGTDDVIWRHSSGETQVWLMKDGKISQQVFAGNSASFEFLAIGNFNGDNYDDVMWQNKTTGAVSIWNMGPGGVVAPHSNPMLDEGAIAAGLANGTVLSELDTFNFLPEVSNAPLESASAWLGAGSPADDTGGIPQLELLGANYDLIV